MTATVTLLPLGRAMLVIRFTCRPLVRCVARYASLTDPMLHRTLDTLPGFRVVDAR